MTQHHDSTGRLPGGQAAGSGMSRIACSKVEIMCLRGKRKG